MILPIVSFGSSVLRKRCIEISEEYPDLDSLLVNMWETMYEASGVGLAAPQINKAIRLFLIDTSSFVNEEKSEGEKSVKKVFINARIIEESGEKWDFNEGCLSIPEIREDITRKSSIMIEYFDENFKNSLRNEIIKGQKNLSFEIIDQKRNCEWIFKRYLANQSRNRRYFKRVFESGNVY